MGSPCFLDDLEDYSFEDALAVIRDRLQRRESDQNRLDGGGSHYVFTREDAIEYLRGITAEDPSAMEKGNIAPLFKNRERTG